MPPRFYPSAAAGHQFGGTAVRDGGGAIARGRPAVYNRRVALRIRGTGRRDGTRAMVRVTAAVIERDGRVLIARRPAGKRRGGLWEFPGGKLEAGEDPRDCLRRELREELGVEAEVGELLVRHVQAYDDFTIELWSYRARLVSGTPEAREHEALAWVVPAELGGYEFPAADVPTVELLRRSAKEEPR